jgi:hypothetical protein
MDYQNCMCKLSPPPPDYRYIFHSHTPTYTHTRTQINIRHDSSLPFDMINLFFNTLMNMYDTSGCSEFDIFSCECQKVFVLINFEITQLRIYGLLKLSTN